MGWADRDSDRGVVVVSDPQGNRWPFWTRIGALCAAASLAARVGFLVSLIAASVASAKTEGDATRQILDDVHRGSAAYVKHDYREAIRFYSEAVDLNKSQPTLDTDTWRVVVDNLGMAYGATGDNRTAKTIFEYGLSKDETYPMFHYNLACAYAELNDLDSALVHLKLAVKYKNNMIRGEHLPNPATDGSFARFVQDPRFRRTLEEIHGE